MRFRVGQGFDFHPLEAGRKLILGGVEIAHTAGLRGHSDADVAAHALANAILGALGEGDLGQHFPDSDPRYQNADSIALLETVWKRATDLGWSLVNADVTITYTGLEIKGGLGTDYIENDAKDGIVIDGNGNGDIVILGGGHGMATVGTGTGDIVEVGNSALGSAGDPATAVNDTVKFGSASTATLDVYGGAEAGSTASTTNIGLTKVLDAAAGLNMYFWNLFSHTSIIADETAAVASAKNLTAAENHAVAALDGPGVAYFTYKGNEYFVATDFAETKVSASCEVVKLVGVTDLTATNSAGVVTLHHVG